jgi:hypothetical protein
MSALVYVALGMVLGWCLHGRLTRNAAEQLRIVKARERDELERTAAVASYRMAWRMNVTEMN